MIINLHPSTETESEDISTILSAFYIVNIGQSDKNWLILIIGGQFRNFIKGGRDVYGWLGVKIPGN